MAMRSESLLSPSWLRVEIKHDVRTLEYRLDIGVRCRDGWAHLVSMECPIGYGTPDMVEMRKAKAYELAHNFITKQLAIETLENT